MDENSPALLAERMLDGDAGAFGLWFDRYFPRVHGWVFRRVEDPDAARRLTEEILRTALERLPEELLRTALERRPEASDAETLDAWMLGVAQRCLHPFQATDRRLPAAS